MSLKYNLKDFSISSHLEPSEIVRLKEYFVRADKNGGPQDGLVLASFLYNRACALHPANNRGEEIVPPPVLEETFKMAFEIFRDLAHQQVPTAIDMMELYNNGEMLGPDYCSLNNLTPA